MQLPNWPFLTRDMSGLPGVIKSRPEDFIVEEVPQYEASGQGDHTYFFVEKTGVTTLDMVRRIARALGRPERDFGYAGLKDAQAVTRQVMSLEHADAERIQALEISGVKVLWTNRHTNKIRLGHLRGNKFQIKVRKVPAAGCLEIAEKTLNILSQRGVPNYFGPQRFGMRGDNWILGRAILRGDAKGFLDHFCGTPLATDRDQVRKARELYDKGHFELAAHIWPGFFRDAKRACQILGSRPGDYARAFGSVDHKLKKLFVSAYQSYLFNQVLASRIDTLDKLVPGDLAAKEDNGAVFQVADVAVEQPRVDRWEISPTGPIFGYRMMPPEGMEAHIEQEILTAEGLAAEDFKKVKGHKLKGSRRPFRVRLTNLEVRTGTDDAGEFLFLGFDLPSGSYATAVLRELMKENLDVQNQMSVGAD